MDKNQIEVKVALVGAAESGKTTFIKFLKGTNIQQAHDEDRGNTESYNETWGLQAHIIEWESLYSQ